MPCDGNCDYADVCDHPKAKPTSPTEGKREFSDELSRVKKEEANEKLANALATTEGKLSVEEAVKELLGEGFIRNYPCDCTTQTCMLCEKRAEYRAILKKLLDSNNQG